MSMNKVILIGNLGTDPEIRTTASAQSVCNFSLATSRKWTDRNSQTQEETEWHRIVVWGRQAENCKEFLSKGRQVCVEGRLQTRQWEDKTGNKRYTTEIIAQNVQFLGGGSGGGRGGASSGGGNAGGGFTPPDAPPFDAGPSGNDDDIPF